MGVPTPTPLRSLTPTVTAAPGWGWAASFTVPLAQNACSGLQEAGSRARATASGPEGRPTVTVREAPLLARLVSAVQLVFTWMVYALGTRPTQLVEATPVPLTGMLGMDFWLNG